MVEVVAPGERWEIEFMEDGAIQIERFRSDGQIEDASALHELWSLVEDRQALRKARSITR